MSPPRLLLVLAACLAILAAVPSASAQQAQTQKCGGGVVVVRITCQKARQIVEEYLRKPSREVAGFICKATSQKRGRCVLDLKVVSFPLD
jgi:hypothetical protein